MTAEIRKCFGTKEYSKKSFICKACETYVLCYQSVKSKPYLRYYGKKYNDSTVNTVKNDNSQYSTTTEGSTVNTVKNEIHSTRGSVPSESSSITLSTMDSTEKTRVAKQSKQKPFVFDCSKKLKNREN